MTMKEVFDVVLPLNRERRVQWLIDLGWEMTVSARAGYPLAKQKVESIPHLMAFNELQHQLFNYLRHMRTQDDWTIQNFLEGLSQKAKASKVDGEFAWALTSSIQRITGTVEGSGSQST